MKRALAMTLCAALSSCASSPTSDSVYGDVTGTIYDPAGNSLGFPAVEDASALSYTGNACTGSGAESELEIFLSSRLGVCSALQGGEGIANSAVLAVGIVGDPAQSGGAAPAIGVGTYNIGSGQTDASGNIYDITVSLVFFDGVCGETEYYATSGSVVISAINDSQTQGSFTANFDNNDGMLSGDFNSPSCSVQPANHCASGSGSCDP